jgi:lysozyme family protein
MTYFVDKKVFVNAIEEEKIAEETGQVPEMAIFDRAMKFVLRWEGGYVNHPSDPGGETNYGISKRAHPDVDIANLTEGGAKDIYKKEYWDEIKGDELPDAVAIAVMDYAVNSGVAQASRSLQTLVHAGADGQIGPNTISQVKVAAELLGEKILAQKVVLQRSDFLCGLISNPDYIPFMKGWMRRTHSLMAEVTE